MNDEPTYQDCDDTLCARCGRRLPKDSAEGTPDFEGFCTWECAAAYDKDSYGLRGNARKARPILGVDLTGTPSAITWAQLTKRTEDPKLAWLEHQLHELGICTRRNGESWHAPIMEVDASQLDKAWAFLQQPFDDADGESVDDMPDDHETFVSA